jgi:osmotically-inducible protein OsmY
MRTRRTAMLRKTLVSTCAVAVLAFSMVTTAFAQTSDAALANEVSKRIRNYVFYSVFDDVEGTVHDGVVSLTGKVRLPFVASEIAKLVARVPGVREVDNRIESLPVSTFDDELRIQIATRIYRDPLFWNYAIQPVPPIHIIVENGHVTLKGVVDSEVERRVAETIARSAFGVFEVNNHLQLERDLRAAN